MTGQDYVAWAAVAVAVAAAIGYLWRLVRGRSGGCGPCGSCGEECPYRRKAEAQERKKR